MSTRSILRRRLGALGGFSLLCVGSKESLCRNPSGDWEVVGGASLAASELARLDARLEGRLSTSGLFSMSSFFPFLFPVKLESDALSSLSVDMQNQTQSDGKDTQVRST